MWDTRKSQMKYFIFDPGMSFASNVKQGIIETDLLVCKRSQIAIN